MVLLPKSRILYWTHHARAKMQFYGLSEGRVRRVLHSPKRTEEGIAPKTITMMQPASVKSFLPACRQEAGRPTSVKSDRREATRQETWNQEIWVMIQDEKNRRKVISAWRYPGRTKPRSEVTSDIIRKELRDYVNSR